MSPMPKKSDTANRKIVRELRQALEYLGADRALADLGPVDLYQKLQELGANREFLAAVGSWGDTLDDEEVLALLEDWNAAEAKLITKAGGCDAVSGLPGAWESPDTVSQQMRNIRHHQFRMTNHISCLDIIEMCRCR